MRKRKKAAIAAVTAAAAAGLVTGALFDTPADLMAAPETAAVETQTVDGGAAEIVRQTAAARLRQWVLALPAAVRMLVGVPLWCLGWVLLSALSALWGGAAPLAGRLLSWLCLAAVLLAVFAGAAKAAFPKLPMRRILRPGTVLFVLAVTLVLGLADLVLPTVWQGYDAETQLVWRLGASCLLAFLCCRLLGRCGKTAPPPAPMSQRTAVEEAARALADSVTPKR
jgi:hypothetical protein